MPEYTLTSIVLDSTEYWLLIDSWADCFTYRLLQQTIVLPISDQVGY